MRVLITGASRGLGLGFCSVLAQRGDSVLAVCRAPTPELAALGVEVLAGCELTDDAATARISAALDGRGLDALICNAGINRDAPTLEQIELPALAAMYDVNALGAVRATLACLDHLNPGARIMLVGVGASAMNMQAPSVGNYGYRMSKAALTSFGYGLARDLRHREIAVLICSPGPVDTDMLRGVVAEGRTVFDPAEAPSANQAAEMLIARLDELTLENSPCWQNTPTGEPVTFG